MLGYWSVYMVVGFCPSCGLFFSVLISLNFRCLNCICSNNNLNAFILFLRYCIFEYFFCRSNVVVCLLEKCVTISILYPPLIWRRIRKVSCTDCQWVWSWLPKMCSSSSFSPLGTNFSQDIVKEDFARLLSDNFFL